MPRKRRLSSVLGATTALVGGCLGSGSVLAAALKEPAAAWVHVAGFAGVVLGAGVIGSLALSPLVRRMVIPAPREQRLADILQFHRIVGNAIETKDGSLELTIRLRGVDYGSRTEGEIRALYLKRHGWLFDLCERGEKIKVLSVRERVSVDTEGEYAHPVLQEIHDRWNASFRTVYVNRHYIVLSVKADKGGQKRLKELKDLLFERLHDYGPEVLENGNGPVSPLLSMWAARVNGFAQPVEPNTENISERLVYAHVDADSVPGLIVYRDGHRARFACVLSVASWGDSDSGELVRRLLCLNGTVEVLQLVEGQAKGASLKRLPFKKAQSQFPIPSSAKREQFDDAMELVNSDRERFCFYQFNVILTADSLDELDELKTAATKVFVDFQHRAYAEIDAAEWVWRCRLPGFNKMIRRRDLACQNVASLLRFDEEPAGLDRSDWGPGAIRMFKTAAGSAYGLNLHISDRAEELAHSVTFAPAGAGKTTLWQHLIGGALRHRDLFAVAFDRFQGMRIFTEAVGGAFINPADGESVSLNPLQQADTPENRDYLKNFLLQLAGADDDESAEVAQRAVEQIYSVRRMSARSLNSVWDSSFDTGSKVRQGLKRWIGEGGSGRLFNGARDSLDLDTSQLVTFEMTAVLAEGRGREAAALIGYIMHRIRQKARAEARPHLVFIDETAPLLEDEIFRKNVQVLFREHRKLRGSVNVVFQDVGAMLGSGIAETVLNQCPTRFVFPNANARQEDYAALELSQAQWEYVKGISPIARALPRSVLVKRGPEAVILNVDLTPLGPYLQVYRSGTEPVKLMTDLKRQWGDRWLGYYLGFEAA